MPKESPQGRAPGWRIYGAHSESGSIMGVSRARVITFANQKGGSGKSLAANLFARILSEGDDSVLVVDCDGQTGNLTSDLGVSKEVPERSLASLLDLPTRPKASDVEAAIQPAPDLPGVSVLAGTESLAAVTTRLSDPSCIGAELCLRRVVEAVSDRFDWVVIDTAGDFTKLSHAALVATDDVLIPCRATASSVQGAKTIIDLVAAVAELNNPRLRVAGVFLNDFNGQAIVHRDIAQAVSSLCSATGTSLMATRLRHSVNADVIATYAKGPGELVRGTVRRGLVRDAYDLVGEYVSSVRGEAI